MSCLPAPGRLALRGDETRPRPADSDRLATTLLIDTRMVSPGERVDFWASSASEVYHPLHIRAETGERFQARMWGNRLGPLSMFRVAASANTMSRTRSDIAVGDPECVQLSILLRGRMVCEQRHSSVLEPGDMTVYDSSEPAIFHAPGPFDMIALELPKAALSQSTRQLAHLTGFRFPRSSGLPRLAVRLAHRTAARLANGGLRPDGSCPEDDALELLRRLHLHATSTQPGPSAGRAELLWRAHGYIDSHLGDPSLSPDTIACACFISTRYLHRLFADEGHSVCEWIRSERLTRCRRDLLDPALQHEPISTIATRWGLPSASHFSRLFREANGCSPREFRRAAMTTGGIGAR